MAGSDPEQERRLRALPGVRRIPMAGDDWFDDVEVDPDGDFGTAPMETRIEEDVHGWRTRTPT